jgi:4-carboxymuconolactone decarboxylase
MAQLPDPFTTLAPEARAVYDRITRKRGPVRGPYAPLMHHPPLAERVGALGEYLRFDSTLPPDVRELAILVTARAVGQPYEWVMHAPLARQAGVPEDVIERVRTGSDPASLPAPYADAARVVAHTLRFESIPAELQERVQARLGLPGLLELVVLAGFYRLIAGVLDAFDVPLPEGERAPF